MASTQPWGETKEGVVMKVFVQDNQVRQRTDIYTRINES